MSQQRLENKIVLVTGGGSGIGRECALAYLRCGAKVVVADSDPEAVERVSGELGDGGRAVVCDVGDGPSVRALLDSTLDLFGALDAVHNNAGISTPAKPLHETSEEEWDRIICVNVKSVYWTARWGVEHLAKRCGSILNTASLVGLIGQSDHAAYVASKGAMISLTKAMALDYAPMGVRVNAICPAGVWTSLLRQWVDEQKDPAEVARRLDGIHALGYCPEADVIADAAIFLISDDARFITGCILPVSGGAELGYRH